MVQQLFFMELKFILESLLIAAPKPLSPAELRDILTKAADEEGAAEHVRACRKLPLEKIGEALARLAQDHEEAARSYRLACVAGAWQFVTLPDSAPWLRAFVGVKNRPTKLSQPALETLAVIAYRQPVTRGEIETIRGVSAEAGLNKLLEREIVYIVGRADTPGRPIQYGTTDQFLEFVGIKSLDELPASDVLSSRQIDDWLKNSSGTHTATDTDMGLADEQLPLESAMATTGNASDETRPAAS